jgi:two-component system chemotaxis response regulator CheY
MLGTILIVDEKEDVRKSVRPTLTKAGYEAVDAILCDIHMPKVNNNNGVEAVAFFRQQLPPVPVIVMTGQPDLKRATDLVKQGVMDYLIKPVRPDKLTEVVSKHAKGHVY